MLRAVMPVVTINARAFEERDMNEKAKILATLLAGVMLLPLHAAEDKWQAVDQGWTANQKNEWYNTSQGSRLIPKDWLMALERADGERKFIEPAHTDSFRYLTNAGAPLPLGFAIDAQSDSGFSKITKLRWKKNQGDRAQWVGLNCAACHTSEITFQGNRLRIDGGPAQSDFQSYMKALNDAIASTRRDPLKWKRFGDAVLGSASNATARQVLQKEVDKFLEWQLKVEQANASELKYGFSRLDAFGHIFNKVVLRANEADPNAHRNPADAPVSYPFLWNIHQHDLVQWNASVENKVIGTTDLGALVRNVGEVTGVFSDLILRKRGIVNGAIGYTTSADIRGLLKLEHLVSQLKPPAWPDVFPAIDANRWSKGEALFKGRCAGCHLVLARDDLTQKFKVNREPVFGANALGTDPWMACNAITYQATTGVLRNTHQGFIVGVGKQYGENALVSDMLGTTVIGSIYNRKHDLIDAIITPDKLREFLAKPKHFSAIRVISQAEALAAVALFEPALPPREKEGRLAFCQQEQNLKAVVYKGRPLNGIWATGPYLHNGSVPTLYDLLLPAEQRPVAFPLGTREFDPIKVGFVTDKTAAPYLTERAQLENTFIFRSRDATGSPIAGNGNAGHDYGNALLTDEERFALVEYMKAVGASRVGDKVVE